MSQSRAESIVEAVVNTAIGFVVSSFAWAAVVCPVWGIPYQASQNFGITAFFTALSFARNYAVRRFFASYLKAFSKRIARTFE